MLCTLRNSFFFFSALNNNWTGRPSPFDIWIEHRREAKNKTENKSNMRRESSLNNCFIFRRLCFECAENRRFVLIRLSSISFDYFWHWLCVCTRYLVCLYVCVRSVCKTRLCQCIAFVSRRLTYNYTVCFCVIELTKHESRNGENSKLK